MEVFMELTSQKMRKIAPEMDPLRIGCGWKKEDLSKPQIMIESTAGDSHPGSESTAGDSHPGSGHLPVPSSDTAVPKHRRAVRSHWWKKETLLSLMSLPEN